ncbi:DUF3016 domain-containing protein [Luteimonas sp. BDR2-5]|uniref:DUF3016 domain-containing protein n=1 Tax=Proluteimonas luteida TaxID=2878685 RepID=UPI001E3C1C34|nr:DUF3016 domain-containing protein [Luteimonas sp. BDR2-5]MCD9029822.1 DUF3016 domain-containing protein [Luteimonas sp. BDR2-5]
MNRTPPAWLLAAALTAIAAPVLARSDVTAPDAPRNLPDGSPVAVQWTDPATFSDLRFSGNRWEAQRGNWVEGIAAHLRQRAERELPPGDTLDVTIRDIQRAGIYEPWRGPRLDHVRIVKDQYPPRIDLDFVLRDADGNVLAEGSRELRDMGFLNRPGAAMRNDSLRYEKQLIDDWLRRELRQPVAGR